MRAESLKKWYGGAVAALIVAQLLLVLVSWLLSAMMVDGVRSLLSSEGLRWFFGSFTSLLDTPALVWLLLLAMAGGSLVRSGLLHRGSTYRDKTALHSVVIVMALYVAAVLALVALPHAVLLSATGNLFPSPFSRAFVPIVSFGLLLASALYGRVSGRFPSTAAVADAACYGIAQAAPLFLFYVLIIQFAASLRFVFSTSVFCC